MHRHLLQTLEVAVGQCLPSFGPQHVSNVMWGFATLGHCPGPQLLDELASHATDLFCFDLQQVFLLLQCQGTGALLSW